MKIIEMELKNKIEDMLIEVEKAPCYDKRKKASFWLLDKTPCIILDTPTSIEKRKSIEIVQTGNNDDYEEIGFISIDKCLIQESNCDFVVFKGKTMIFCEDKMNMSSKDKLDTNLKDAMKQIRNSKDYFNEQLLGLGKVEAFIGIPNFFTKNPNAYRKLQKEMTDEFNMTVKIGQKVSI